MFQNNYIPTRQFMLIFQKLINLIWTTIQHVISITALALLYSFTMQNVIVLVAIFYDFSSNL